MEAIDAAVRKLLAPIFVVSGAIVVVGFFFPAFVGDVISGHAWLTVALVFFGSGLGYLSLLPLEVASDSRAGSGLAEDVTATDPRRLFIIQRYSRVETVVAGISRQDQALVSAAIGGLLVFFGGYLFAPAQTLGAIGAAQTLLMRELGWLFTGPILLSVVFCLVVLFGPWGAVILSGEDAQPTYTYPVYFTMFLPRVSLQGSYFGDRPKHCFITRSRHQRLPRNRSQRPLLPAHSRTRSFTGGFRFGALTSSSDCQSPTLSMNTAYRFVSQLS